jgi:hypothetical protein
MVLHLVIVTQYPMEYCPVEYEKPTYFQLSVAYVDIKQTLNMRKDM